MLTFCRPNEFRKTVSITKWPVSIMIQQLLELSMPTNFSVFWVYPASQRAGGWPAGDIFFRITVQDRNIMLLAQFNSCIINRSLCYGVWCYYLSILIHYTCNIDLFRKSISGINFQSLATHPSMCEWLDVRFSIHWSRVRIPFKPILNWHNKYFYSKCKLSPRGIKTLSRG